MDGLTPIRAAIARLIHRPTSPYNTPLQHRATPSAEGCPAHRRDVHRRTTSGPPATATHRKFISRIVSRKNTITGCSYMVRARAGDMQALPWNAFQSVGWAALSVARLCARSGPL